VDGASASFVVEAITGIPPAPSDLSAVASSSTTVMLAWDVPHGNGLEGFDLERATNPAFTGKVTDIFLHTGGTQFTDTGLTPGTVYYYQIDTFNVDGVSKFSHAATVITYAAGEEIMDDTASAGVTIDGSWSSNTAITGYDGTDYLQDDDTGKGNKSVKYRPDLTSAGIYAVYATWTTAADRATNVPFDVFSKNGDLLETVRVNQRTTGGEGWTLIGDFFLHSGTASFVRIRNTRTNGEVIANAIKFLPMGDIERNDGQLVLPTTTAATTDSVEAVTATPDDKNELKALREEVE
jgi:hypothetical protein